MGLGGVDRVTLAQARVKAAACSAAMAEGDPPSSALVSAQAEICAVLYDGGHIQSRKVPITFDNALFTRTTRAFAK